MFFLYENMKSLYIFIICLLITSFIILLDRKILGSIQRRMGPFIPGLFGILQPFADALKLLKKEWLFPTISEDILFLLSSFWCLFFSLYLWTFLVIGPNFFFFEFEFSLIGFFIVSSLGIYGLIFAGWASNSKYPFLGAQRAAAQLISYEIIFGILITILGCFTKTYNIFLIVLLQQDLWFIVFLIPISFIFFIILLIETNRHPFDLPEAESELVSGYNVEYSSMLFAFFILAEYLKIFGMSVLFILLFFGGWYMPFFVKTNIYLLQCIFVSKISIFIFLFSWIRAIVPRYRYDQLMKICWCQFYPLSIGFLFFYFGFFILIKYFFIYNIFFIFFGTWT